MIDTIRFRVKIDENQRRELIRNSISFRKRDHRKRLNEYKIYTAQVNLPSYNHQINIILSDSDLNHCKIELSLPKYLYNHNVYLIYGDIFKFLGKDLYINIRKMYPSFPNILDWEVVRVDVCYAWKFLNESIAQSILTNLSLLNYPRNNKIINDTSVMWYSRLSSKKFYLKKPEFYYHDFKRLLKNGETDLAYEILNVSEGVLRFEVTLRHQALEGIFGKGKICYNEITEDFCLDRLSYYFNKLLKKQHIIFMNSQTVFDKLISVYSPKYQTGEKNNRMFTKSLQLYQFYCMYYSKNKIQRDLYLSKLPKPTFYRNLALLRKAGIGLPDDKDIANIELDIPSPYVVNHETKSRA